SIHDLNFGKYFKAVTSTGKKVMLHVSILVLTTHKNYGTEMSIHEFCCQKLNFSDKDLKKIFHKDLPKTHLSLNDPKLLGDVTFFYKIVDKMLGPLPDSLKNNLSELKNLRNCVCHEEFTINDNDLSAKFGSLKSLCTDIMKDVDVFTSTDSTKFLDTIVNDLNDLLYQSDSADIAKLIESYKHFRDDLVGKLITRGRKELRTSYASLKILNPFNWLKDDKFPEFTVQNVFTVLQLTQSNQKIELSRIIELDKTPNSRFLARVIILSGIFGSGKTSLCRYLVHEWCSYSSDVGGLREYDLLLHINIQWVTSNNLKQFIVEELLPIATRDIKPEDVVHLLQNIKVLFVIDGYDERNDSSRALVKEILTKFTESKIVIASRPEFTLEIKNQVGQHIEVGVLGFDKQCLEEYVEKVMITLEPSECERQARVDSFLAMVAKNKCLQDQLALPLAASLILILWFKDPETASKIQTSTNLYDELFKMFRMKLVSRLLAQSSSHQVQVEKSVNAWYKHVTKLAWKMLLNDTLYLSEEDRNNLMSSAEALGINPIETLSTFLCCQMSESISGTSYSFSFIHNSTVEFMAAEYFASVLSKRSEDELPNRISQNREQEILNELRRSGNLRRFKEMIVYTFGLLPKLDVQGDEASIPVPIIEFLLKILVEELSVSEEEIELWTTLIDESNYDSSVRYAIGATISSNSWWSINESFKPLTNAHIDLLKATFSAPSRLSVDINLKSTREIPNLAQFLKLVAISKKCEVSLHFGRQFNVPEEEEKMDHMVVPLLMADSVIELTGHGGVQAVKSLNVTTKLRFLALRISSLEALSALAEYFRKIYSKRLFSFMIRSNKKTLTDFELFLDIKPNSVPAVDLPRLNFHGRRCVLKFCKIADEQLEWCMNCFLSLGVTFSYVVFFSSDVTYSGINKLLQLKSMGRHKMKAILVLSSYQPTTSEIQSLHSHTTPIVRW
ncbi:P-loop containing nucleoside triphosphate hydrolase, partial [Trinorchestia longiramus]